MLPRFIYGTLNKERMMCFACLPESLHVLVRSCALGFVPCNKVNQCSVEASRFMGLQRTLSGGLWLLARVLVD